VAHAAVGGETGKDIAKAGHAKSSNNEPIVGPSKPELCLKNGAT
jgi:hypothetical protein